MNSVSWGSLANETVRVLGEASPVIFGDLIAKGAKASNMVKSLCCCFFSDPSIWGTGRGSGLSWMSLLVALAVVRGGGESKHLLLSGCLETGPEPLNAEGTEEVQTALTAALLGPPATHTHIH